MSAKRKKLMSLIEQGEFKEARRFIRTLNHPKQSELLTNGAKNHSENSAILILPEGASG